MKFLTREQLSSARFAEIIGVQPSSISHIISGRNKPGFDFIQKILVNYPSLNAEWLITGKGSMFKEENIQGNLFTGDDPEKNDLNKQVIENQADRPDDRKSGNVNDNNNITNTNVTNKVESSNYKSEAKESPGVTNVIKGKVVEKIVIFYSDKSFSEYSPE